MGDLCAVEFGSNILLFVPLGALLAVILAQRHLVLPIATVTTVAIESAQALALRRLTPSVMDIVANLTGACVGLLALAFFEMAESAQNRAAGLSDQPRSRALILPHPRRGGLSR